MRSTAIKVFTYEEKFYNELLAYKRLNQRRVRNVLGFSIPVPIGGSRELKVIEMSIVQPPFLVDFSQATIDTEPDFPEGMDEWWARLADDFGDRLPIVQRVFWTLKAMTGICYYDLAPRNMNFGDDPTVKLG